MDAPNAPNPANPNAQDQNADAVQGPTNRAQGPAVQSQLKVLLKLVKIYQSNHHNNWSQYNLPLLVL